jgi:hypothetical protein
MKIDTDCLLIVFNFIPLKELRQLYLLNKYFKKIILEYILFSKFKIPDDFIHSLKLDGHDVLSLGLYGSESFGKLPNPDTVPGASGIAGASLVFLIIFLIVARIIGLMD